MLFTALAATLCGARACTEIADYAEANCADLQDIVVLPGRTPSHDSVRRQLRLIDPAHLECALRRFVQAIRQGRGLGPASGVVALRGCIVTTDALHRHRETARTIRAQGGANVLKLKANHGPLWRAAQAAFAEPRPPRRSRRMKTPTTAMTTPCADAWHATSRAPIPTKGQSRTK